MGREMNILGPGREEVDLGSVRWAATEDVANDGDGRSDGTGPASRPATPGPGTIFAAMASDAWGGDGFDFEVGVRGHRLRATMDTGCRGFSLLSQGAADAMALRATSLPEHVTIWGPLGGAGAVATQSAQIEVDTGRTRATIEVLIIPLAGDAELYISREDMPALGYAITDEPTLARVTPDADAGGAEEKSTRTIAVRPVGVFRELELRPGVRGPLIGDKYNAGNTVNFDAQVERCLDALRRAERGDRPFVNKTRRPVCIRVKRPEGNDDRPPWDSTHRARFRSHEVEFEAWVSKQIERGVLESAAEYDAPGARPAGINTRIAVFMAGTAEKPRPVANCVGVNRWLDLEEVSIEEPDLLRNIIERAATADVISKIDLRSAFDQVRLDRDHGLQFYLSVCGRTYRLNSLPQGLASSPSIFNALVAELLSVWSNESEPPRRIPREDVLHYFDDVAVASRVTRTDDGLFDIEAHVSAFVAVIDRLAEDDGMTINIDKTTILSERVEIGGWIVGGGSIEISPDKRSALGTLAIPTTGAGLRKALGFLTFLAEMAPGVSVALKDCYAHSGHKGQLSKLGTEVVEKIRVGFEAARERLAAASERTAPRWDRRFILATDASRRGLGAVLMQTTESGERVVVSFASRALSSAEGHYSASQLEMLAIVFALRRYEYYLRGRRFDLWSDHRSLVGALGRQDPKDLCLRWWEYLQGFAFEMKHIPGHANTWPDALSRAGYEREHDPEWESEISAAYQAVPASVVIRGLEQFARGNRQPFAALRSSKRLAARTAEVAEATPTSPRPRSLSAASAASDAEMATVTEWPATPHMQTYTSSGKPRPPRSDFGEVQDRWYPHHAYRLAPEKDRAFIMTKYHEAGHQGIKGVVDAIHYDGWSWPGIWDQVGAVIAACETCAKHVVRVRGYHPTEPDTYNETYPGRHWAIDTTTLPEAKTGHKYLFVVVDVATRRVWTKASRTKEALAWGKFLGRLLMTETPPMIVSSDNGSEFLNAVIKEMKEKAGLSWRTVSEYNPAGNAPAEAAVKRVQERLRRLVDMDKADWPLRHHAAAYIVNTTLNKRTGTVPFDLYFGRPVRAFTDYTHLGAIDPEGGEERFRDLERRRLDDAAKLLDVVIPGLTERQHDIAEERERRSIEDRKIVKFKVGDLVMVDDFRGGLTPKLDRLREGPYEVSAINRGSHRLIALDGTEYPNRVPTSRLSLFKGEKPGSKDEAPKDGGTIKTFTIEKVINHRITKSGAKEYLSRWKGYKKPSWVAEDMFNTVECINDYWRDRTARERKEFRS